MTSADNSQGLSARELQTLLLAGPAMSQEQDEERIYHWVVDAAASLLGARVAAFGVTPVAGRSPQSRLRHVGVSLDLRRAVP